jgi:hypothetical protein
VQYLADMGFRAIDDTRAAADRWVKLNHYGKRGKGHVVPAIHMPRWASRITLEVIDVRVERLQAISDGDAIAEGAPCIDEVTGREVLFPSASKCGTFKLGYRWLWESINGPGSWDANPWVWVVEFPRVTS